MSPIVSIWDKYRHSQKEAFTLQTILSISLCVDLRSEQAWKSSSPIQLFEAPENYGEFFQLNRNLIQRQLFFIVKMFKTRQKVFWPLCNLLAFENAVKHCLKNTQIWQNLTFWIILKSCRGIKFLLNWKNSPQFSDA